MSKALNLLVFLAALALSTPASASKEGIVPFGSFNVESPGLGQSGPVTVSGVQGSKGIEQLTIKAFGRHFSLSPAQLTMLGTFSVNGLQLSYEGGYKELGGRTLYVQFRQGFTSGSRAEIYVEVSESGTVQVRR